MVAVTGTNETVSSFCRQIWTEMGRCRNLGTTGVEDFSALAHTTPDPITL